MAVKQKKIINMTILYILIGVFFVLLTGLNIYAYFTISGMSRTYAELGFVSRNFRLEFQNASYTLQEIINGNKDKTLDDVWNHLKKAASFTSTLAKLESSLADLNKNIEQFQEAAKQAYQENDLNIKQELFLKSEKAYQYSNQRIDAFESRIKEVIDNEMGFVSLLYIILLSSNILMFAAIFYVVFYNNRQQKAMAEKLNNENANLNAIMQGLDSVLLTIDNTGVIRNWNGNAEKYFDRPESEVLGKNIYEILPIFNQFKDFFNTVQYSAKRHFKYHERININKGPMRVVNILCVPMLSSAFKSGYSELLVKIDDVTTYRIEDEQFIQKQKLLAINGAMNAVALDYVPLLESLHGATAALDQIAANHGCGNEIQPYTAFIDSIGMQFPMVPRKYMAVLSKSQDNKIHIDLNEMIMYVLRICQKTFEHKINIEVALNESKSWILANPPQLAEALLVFLDNAAAAMTTMKIGTQDELGGILSVSVEKINGDKVACEQLMRFRQALAVPPFWVIIISDTGVGISPENMPNLFVPFFTTKNNPENRGVGLTMAQNTVQALGGYIEVSSKPGRGTIFKIFLPETDNTASKSNDATTDSSLRSDDSNIPPGNGVILLVDDDNMMCKITGKLLEKLGYDVISAGNGYSALNLYLEHMDKISCVILDLSTKEMSNADTYFALRNINPEIKVIALSDSDQDESSMKLRENGFADFIRRPFSLESLAKNLKRLTETDIEVS